MMIFKYWIEFDEEGSIKTFYKSKPVDNTACKEYIVKLIPIDRDITKDVGKTTEDIRTLGENFNKLDTEFKKLTRELRRIKI